MERDTRSAGEEFRVAVAGPLVTLAIALACFGAGALLSGADRALDSTRLNAVAGDEALSVLGWLAFVNAALLVFNLIPGFPLDGGRIARAVAWWRTGDRARATRFAARLGRGVSVLMIGFGVFLLFTGSIVSGVWLAFIGFFLGPGGPLGGGADRHHQPDRGAAGGGRDGCRAGGGAGRAAPRPRP